MPWSYLSLQTEPASPVAFLLYMVKTQEHSQTRVGRLNGILLMVDKSSRGRLAASRLQNGGVGLGQMVERSDGWQKALVVSAQEDKYK